jgi:hypothetical protein
LDRVAACDVAIEQDRTFGPFVHPEDFYSPAPEKDFGQRFRDQVLSMTLHTLNSDLMNEDT